MGEANNEQGHTLHCVNREKLSGPLEEARRDPQAQQHASSEDLATFFVVSKHCFIGWGMMGKKLDADFLPQDTREHMFSYSTHTHISIHACAYIHTQSELPLHSPHTELEHCTDGLLAVLMSCHTLLPEAESRGGWFI